jgi:DNA modification methylase
MEKSSIHIVQVPISELKLATYNPRTWNERAIKNLTESIQRFGLVDPILVNSSPKRKNVTIGGHFRLKVAKDLGYTKVPVVYLNIPDEQKEKELNLRLNRNTGDWDFEILKEFDIDLLLDVGFDDSDLSVIWDEALGVEDDEFRTREELEQIGKPETKEGDVFQLGKHRLVCGDSTDPEVLKKLLGKTKINMIYSDPPYNIGFDYVNGIGTNGKYRGTKTDDNKSESEYREFLEATLQNGLKHCHEDAHVFYWCDQNYIGLLQDLYKCNNVDPKRVCLWLKNNQNVTPQIAFNKCYEPCVYGLRGKPYLSPKASNLTEITNPEIANGNRTIDDILDILDIWLVRRLPTNEYQHSTEKPVVLHDRPLRRCTRPGDAVLDLFGGSGSTLIACEQLGRKAFLAEHEPVFCDLIIKRYVALNPNNNVTKLN